MPANTRRRRLRLRTRSRRRRGVHACARDRCTNFYEKDAHMAVQPLTAEQCDELKTVKNDGREAEGRDRETLLRGLNSDLAGEYRAILMYMTYSAKLTGPYRNQLRSLFQAEITDEQGHAQYLADKIAALGGEPTSEPRPVSPAAGPREMLECALEAEKRAIHDYTIRIRQAEVVGDLGLKVDLETQIADETRHKEQLERTLVGWDKN